MDQKAEASKFINGKIYKLTNTKTADIYVGSTINTLSYRLRKHKAGICANTKKCNVLTEVGWDNVQIELIELFPCNNRIELHTRERHWIEQLKASLNSRRAIRLPGELYADRNAEYKNNAEVRAKAKERSKAVYQAIRLDLLAKRREQVSTKCGCGGNCKPHLMPRHIKTQRHVNWIAYQAFIVQEARDKLNRR